MQPTWPIVIKINEDHELVYVSSEADWQQDENLSGYPYADEDLVIDSTGRLYSPSYNSQVKIVSLKDLGERILIDDFNRLLRKHLCTTNECCISKIMVANFEQGFDLIRTSSS